MDDVLDVVENSSRRRSDHANHRREFRQRPLPGFLKQPLFAQPEPLVVETHALDSITALLAREDFHEARAIAALYIARDKLKGEQADTSLW